MEKQSSAAPLHNYYTILYQSALSISSSLEIEQVLQRIVKSMTGALAAKGAVLRLLDSETGQLRVAAAYGLSATYLSMGPMDIVDSPLDQETLDHSPVYIPDVRLDERFRYKDVAEKEGLISLMCIPLEVRGTGIGVLRIYTDHQRAFSEEEREFMAILASLAAQAIENARLYDAVRSSYSGLVKAFWGLDDMEPHHPHLPS